jgi:peptidoglycan hydrolase CwlO-like protein
MEKSNREWLKIRRIQRIKKAKGNMIEKLALKVIQYIGSVNSFMVHTAIFATAIIIYFLGLFDRNSTLLVLTTVVSLEAIYLSILIQMSVNIQAKKLQLVAADVDALQKDVDEISENVEDIQEDVGEIQEDVGEIQEDIQEEYGDDDDDDEALIQIKSTLEILMEEIRDLNKKYDEDEDEDITQIRKDISKIMRVIRKIDSRNKQKIDER